MSNLRTLTESRDLGEPSYQDHDWEYTHEAARAYREMERAKAEAQKPGMAQKESSDVPTQQGLPLMVGRVHEESQTIETHMANTFDKIFRVQS